MRRTPRPRSARISATTSGETSSATTSATESSGTSSSATTTNPCARRSWLAIPARDSGSDARTATGIGTFMDIGSATMARSPSTASPASDPALAGGQDVSGRP